jgi:MFS family permease
MFSARTAVTVAFALNGAVYASWASRVPALSVQVHAGPGGLGIALLGTALGMAAGANGAGRVAARFGARRTVLASGTLTALAVPLLGLARSIPVLGLELVLLGLMIAAMDVAMNVAGVQVVRRLDRPLMPVFHAWFSFGGLFGALGAGLAAWLGLSVLPHLLLVCGAVLVLVWTICRSLPDDRAPVEQGTRETPATKPSKRPVLWLLGAITLCSGLAEGASTDWSALFMVRDRGFDQASAATVFAVFSIAMALTRLTGERLERRFGPYRLLAGACAVAAVGLATTVLIPLPWLGFLGFAMVGAGLAFCFPVGLTLAGAAGKRADGTGGEREIGFVAGVAYTGFLAGPPLIGGIASVTSLAVSFGFVTVIIVLIPLAAKGTAVLRGRELRRVTAGRGTSRV